MEILPIKCSVWASANSNQLERNFLVEILLGETIQMHLDAHVQVVSNAEKLIVGNFAHQRCQSCKVHRVMLSKRLTNR